MATMKEDLEAVERSLDADVLALIGPIERGFEERLVELAEGRRRRTNVLLILATYGGDPSVAYKVARCIQHTYQTRGETTKGRFDVAVDLVCKSAGTLICLGASRLFMSGMAELGPIDIQLRKPDEVGERTSGLTPLQALETLKTQSLSLFKNHFRQLRFDDQLVFSTRAAAEIATKLTVGLMSPVYGQIDPMRLAEVERAIRISGDYAERIAVNLKPDGLAKLLAKYPSHGFVIDRQEARDQLFNEVLDPTAEVQTLLYGLRKFSGRYLEGNNDGPFFAYLSNEPQPPNAGAANEQPNPQNDGAGNQGQGGGDAEVRGPNEAGQTSDAVAGGAPNTEPDPAPEARQQVNRRRRNRA